MKIPFVRPTLVLITALAVSVPAQERAPEKPRPLDAQIAVAVASLMEQGHISRHKLDGEIAGRIQTHLLRFYDPAKRYFLKADIEEFAAFQNQHADRLLKGDLSAAFTVQRRFEQRLTERVGWAKEFVDSNFDFTAPETIVTDPDTAVWAADEAEAKARWKTQVKYEMALRLVDGETADKAKEKLRKRYDSLLRNWRQFNAEEIVEAYIDTLCNCFDPHSSYMSPKTFEDFDIAIRAQLQGIGALLGPNEEGDTTVKEVVPGGAAERDGRLKAGDRIIAVGDGEKGEMLEVSGKKQRDTVKLIRGRAGTKVRLEVIHRDGKREIITITRAKIELQDREAQGEIVVTTDPSKPEGGAKVRIGVIKLPSFYADTESLRAGRDAKGATSDCRRIIDDFKKKGVDVIAMDLRTNGGGLLEEARTLTGLFIDEGPVVQVKDFDGNVDQHIDDEQGVAWSGPLVVMVSRVSASASEIFAAAVQDYGRGVVIGDRFTHGKGSVQKVIDLASQLRRGIFGGRQPPMGSVKLTMQLFYRVNGKSTQNYGVASDVELPSFFDHDDFSERKLDFALEAPPIPAANFRPMGTISPDLIKVMRTRTTDRQKAVPELAKYMGQKAKLDERRDRKTLTFTLDSLKKQKEELTDDEKDDQKDDEYAKKPEKKFGEDAYTREAMRIIADYALLSNPGLANRGVNVEVRN
jgi:carboxyl-terminal processing protease